MKNLNDLDRYRLRGQAVLDVFGGEDDETCGVFVVPRCGRGEKTL